MPDENLVLADRYQARGRLGNGAGAGVEEYLGRDLRLARPVVIQVIRGAGQGGFAPQARLMASLDHPAVASVYDWGQQDDLAYLIREYVPGKDLRTLLAERATLPVAQALAVGAEVAAALAAAHRVGLAHGSLDAADVILGDQRVTVVGFGAAWMREVAGDHDTAGDQKRGGDHGPPSGGHGAPGGGLDGDLQGDLGALGAMLHHMLTGVAPEESATVTPMASTRLTFQLRQVIARLTASDPIVRYQSAEAVRADLLHLARESEPAPTAARPTFAIQALQSQLEAPSRPRVAGRPGGPAKPVAPVEPGAPTEQLATTRPTWVTAPAAGPADPGERVRDHLEDDQPPGRGRRWIMAAIAVSALVIAGALAFAAFTLTRAEPGPRAPTRTSTPTTPSSQRTTVSIGVPDVVGLDQESAIHALREAGFLANVSLRSSRQLAGLVTGQSPRAGQRPPQGAIVFLTVSTGPTTTVAASRSHAPGRAGLTRT